jgi:hypothetical protein
MKEVGPLYPAKIGFTDGRELTSALDVVVIEGGLAALAARALIIGKREMINTGARKRAIFLALMFQLFPIESPSVKGSALFV